VTGAYELTTADGWKTAAGVVGLVLCVLAVYAALAMALEDVLDRTVLPIGRRGPIDGEPGVRPQL
jgi:succinate-acetate transporter protein